MVLHNTTARYKKVSSWVAFIVYSAKKLNTWSAQIPTWCLLFLFCTFLFLVGFLYLDLLFPSEFELLNSLNCHQYFLIPISLLDALQLAAGAIGLFSQGWQQLFMGVLFMHWATIWVKKLVLPWLPSRRAVRMQGITPDFIVEPFIVLSTSYSDNPPLRVGISSHGYHQT